MHFVDHLVVRTRERDALCERLSDITGHPALDGFQPGGGMLSRGIRFLWGPFVDVFQSQKSGLALGLAGIYDFAEEGWDIREEPLPPNPPGDEQPFRIGQFPSTDSVASRFFLIEYAEDRTAFDAPSYRGDLYKAWRAPSRGARLERIWLRVADAQRAGLMLQVLGYQDAGPFEDGRRWRGLPVSIVVTEKAEGQPEGFFRIDIEGARIDADEPWGERLRLTARKRPGPTRRHRR